MFTPTPADKHVQLTVNSEVVRYTLVGVIYYGAVHFTAGFVDKDRQVWFNDGISLGR